MQHPDNFHQDHDRTHNNNRFWDVIAHEYPKSFTSVWASAHYPKPLALRLYAEFPLPEHDGLGLPNATRQPYVEEQE
jgi:hypothetical protein